MGIKNILKWDEVIPDIGMSAKTLFKGDMDAYLLSEMLIRICNIWDDIIDMDKPVSKAEKMDALQSLFIEMECNPFYQKYVPHLHTMKQHVMLSYHTANFYEDSKDIHGIELAHGLRYQIVNMIGIIVIICRGYAGAAEVWPVIYKAFCYERIDDYVKEILSRENENA